MVKSACSLSLSAEENVCIKDQCHPCDEDKDNDLITSVAALLLGLHSVREKNLKITVFLGMIPNSRHNIVSCSPTC